MKFYTFVIFFLYPLVNVHTVTANFQLSSGELKWFLKNFNNTDMSLRDLYANEKVRKILEEIEGRSERRILSAEFCDTERIVIQSLEFYKEVIKALTHPEIGIYLNSINRLVHYGNSVRSFCYRLLPEKKNYSKSENCSHYQNNFNDVKDSGNMDYVVSLYNEFLYKTEEMMKVSKNFFSTSFKQSIFNST